MNRALMTKMNKALYKIQARIREITTFSFSGGVSEFLLEKRWMFWYRTVAKCYCRSNVLEVFDVKRAEFVLPISNFLESEGFKVTVK